MNDENKRSNGRENDSVRLPPEIFGKLFHPINFLRGFLTTCLAAEVECDENGI